MTVTTTPSSPSPDRDKQRLGREPSQPNKELSPDRDTQRRPGGQGKGARRR